MVLGGLAVAALLAGILGARFLPAGLFLHIQNLLTGFHRFGAPGMLLFAAILIAIALSGFVPGSLIGILAGTVYGLPVGFMLAAISTLLGGWLAFLLARSLFRPLLLGLLASRARLQDFDTALGRDGWRFVFLLRISPVMPFAVTSYVLGASSVTMTNYLIGTLGALPALFGYVIVGTLARAGLAAATQGSDIVRWLMIGAGLAATIVLTWRLGRLAASAGLVPGSAALRANGD
jgi:uncharacterized membrane protein YdjX (TVP38/TMEM64 family)